MNFSQGMHPDAFCFKFVVRNQPKTTYKVEMVTEIYLAKF